MPQFGALVYIAWIIFSSLFSYSQPLPTKLRFTVATIGSGQEYTVRDMVDTDNICFNRNYLIPERY